jgi:DNA-binding NarL/FixJ family response regulator
MDSVSSRPRVLVVDDERRTLDGLQILLRTAGLNVVATADDGDDALHKVDQFDIDVVVMDIRMPRMDGVSATRHIGRQRPQTKVILFTAFDSSFEQATAKDAGAAGYLVKARDEGLLPDAVRSAYGAAAEA